MNASTNRWRIVRIDLPVEYQHVICAHRCAHETEFHPEAQVVQSMQYAGEPLAGREESNGQEYGRLSRKWSYLFSRAGHLFFHSHPRAPDGKLMLASQCSAADNPSVI